MTPPKDVEKTLEALMMSWETLDQDRFLSIVSESEDGIFLGTDSDEKWIGKNALVGAIISQFGAFDSIEVSNTQRYIQYSPNGDAAWFTNIADWEIFVGDEDIVLSGVRMTGVFTYENNSWKLRTLHTSLGVEGQAVAY